MKYIKLLFFIISFTFTVCVTEVNANDHSINKVASFLCHTVLNGKSYNYKNSGKGHKEQINLFFESIKKGKKSPIPFVDLYKTTLATFKIIQSINENRSITL